MRRFFPACRRLCWRRPPRKAFCLHQVTPTCAGFSRSAGAFVGVDLPARPLPFVWTRQHSPNFPGLPAPLLAPCSSQALIPSSGHANTARFYPVRRCPCWRLVPRKAFVLRRVTPTWSGFSQLPGAFVGALFPAKPLSFAEPRQHGPDSPGFPAPLLLQFPRKERRRKKVVPRTTFSSSSLPMERVKGIEPSMRAWEARVLPLNYTRKTYSLIILQLRTAVKPFGLTAARF